MKIKLDKIKSNILSGANKINLSAILPFLSQDDLLRWLKQFTETTATIYDNAMDANYLETHIGSYNHRLFDGGHDPVGAWEAIKNASTTDTFSQEVIGYVQAMFKDMSTVQGMPFFNMDKNWYDQSGEWLSSTIPGSSKDWLRDFLTYDTFEILSTSLGIVGALFFLKKKDMERLSQILGSMGIISILSMNPLMGISVVFLTAYSYYRTKERIDMKNLTRGAVSSGVAWMIFSILGLPIIMELIIVLVILKILRNYSYSPKEILNAIINKWNKINAKDRNNILLPESK